MSLKLRTRRLQEYLNDVHRAGLKVDGAFGSRTMGGVEDALAIDEWAAPDVGPPPRDREFDDRTEENLRTLDPKAEPELRKLVRIAMNVAATHDVVVKVISGHRTWAEQDALYAKGRTRQARPGSIVTNAKGGYSNHNFGIAVDFGVFSWDGRYLDGGDRTEKLQASVVHGAIAKAAEVAGLNTEWGGNWERFRDYPHHEVKTGLSMAQKRKLYLEKGSVL